MKLLDQDLERIKTIFYDVYRESIPNEITNATLDQDDFSEIEEIVGRYYNLEGQYLHHAFRLISNVPCQIHCDYGQDEMDVNGSIVILIPFQSNSHTVIFNEECLNTFKEYKLTHSPLENNGIDPVRDGLTHISPENLQYVSIKFKEAWEEGKLIVFDRKLLHCSDDFKTSGVDSKQAAVLWFSYR